jgi:hypothetical protein
MSKARRFKRASMLAAGGAVILASIIAIALRVTSGMSTIYPVNFASTLLPNDAQNTPGALTCDGRRCFTISGSYSTEANTNVVYHAWLMRADYRRSPPVAIPFNRTEVKNLELGGIACPTFELCLFSAASNPSDLQHWPVVGMVTSDKVTVVQRTRVSDVTLSSGIACGSPTWCVATFYSANTSSLMTFNGSHWSPLKLVPGIDQGLFGIQCPSRSLCVVTGTGKQGEAIVTVRPRGVATQWMAFARGGLFPSSVSCPVPSVCVIIGIEKNPKAGIDGYPDVGRVAIQLVPNGRALPASNLTMTLYSPSIATLSCSSASRCVAGGSDGGYDGVTRAIAFNEVRGRWTDERASLASLDVNGFAAVTDSACSTHGDCLITGSYAYAGPPFLSTYGTSGPTRLFVARESRLGTEDLQNLGTENVGSVNGITCPLVHQCLIVLPNGRGTGIVEFDPQA